MIDQVTVTISGGVTTVGQMKPDSPVPLVPLYAKVSSPAGGVKMSHPRFEHKAKLVPGLHHAPGQLGVLAFEKPLVESFDLLEYRPAVDHVPQRQRRGQGELPWQEQRNSAGTSQKNWIS